MREPRGLYGRLVYQPPLPITPELLASVAADTPPRMIFLRLVELIYNRGRDKPGQRAYVAALTPGLRMLWSVLGADEHRALLNRAIEEVRAATGRGLGFDHAQWREHFSRAEVPPVLEWLDGRYWDLPLLEPRQAAYIQAHPEQFVTD